MNYWEVFALMLMNAANIWFGFTWGRRIGRHQMHYVYVVFDWDTRKIFDIHGENVSVFYRTKEQFMEMAEACVGQPLPCIKEGGAE